MEREKREDREREQREDRDGERIEREKRHTGPELTI